MKQITFYLDFVSPYAYLAFERLPEALLGLSYAVDYRPVLFAGLLKHHGQLGPAEIGPKRDWTYRQVLWLAHTHGIAMQMPVAHPFNPLPLLRLALACGGEGPSSMLRTGPSIGLRTGPSTTLRTGPSTELRTGPSTMLRTGLANRYVCETIFHHVWRGGADATDAKRLEALQQALQPRRDPASDEVKGELKSNTQEAIARGLFGVPTCAVDDKLFWGLDALPMLRAYLEDDAWFAGGDWDGASRVAAGVVRSRGRAAS